MNELKTPKIDIEAAVKAKAPNVKIPRFIINYLRRIAHEEEINKFLSEVPDRKNLDFMESSFSFLDIHLKVEGEENLPPKDGRYIFAGNHPIGGLDGVATSYIIGKAYDGKIRLISNDLLNNLEPIRGMFIPVNKLGGQAKESARLMNEFYESENHLLTYPSGKCSRKIKGKITDTEWKKSFIAKAVQYKRDVVPVYFEGRNSDFFYNLANIRKFLGIKFNIEMMYLVDEMFKQRGNEFLLRIGKPIPWQTFDKSKSQTEWAQWVKDIVYKMK
jgi:putative hemolysin